jgi:hypothetical protein
MLSTFNLTWRPEVMMVKVHSPTHRLIYLSTPCSRALHNKPRVAQHAKEFPAPYGTWCIIPCSKQPPSYFNLSHFNPDYILLPWSKFVFILFSHVLLGSQSGLFPLLFRLQFCAYFSPLPVHRYGNLRSGYKWKGTDNEPIKYPVSWVQSVLPYDI